MLTLSHVTKRFPGGVTAVNDVAQGLKVGLVGQMAALEPVEDPDSNRTSTGILPQRRDGSRAVSS